MALKEIYLLLGSNLGDRTKILAKARKLLHEQCGKIEDASAIYITEPWGVKDQPEFLNQVLRLNSRKEPERLLDCIEDIEKQCGKETKEKWGARFIDIDILFYGNLSFSSGRLTIPHPHMHERRFTLVPLAELAPELVHPVLGKTMTELLELTEDDLWVNKYMEV